MELIDLLLLTALVTGILWLGSGFAAFLVARSRGGDQAHWAAFGVFLGPFGLLLAYKLSYPCPQCRAPILRGLRTCPSCHNPIPQLGEDQNPRGSFWSYRRGW